MLKKTLLGLSIAAIAFTPTAAFSYESGDIIVRGGAAKVSPDSSSTMINIDTPALGSTGVNDAGVDSDIQLGVSFTYMMSEFVGVEVLAATPFEHNIDLPLLATDIASTKHLPPTVTLNYHLAEPSSKFQPYVGMGLNYTMFFDEKVTPALDSTATFQALVDATGASATLGGVSGTKIDLEDSTGVAIHAGFDYQFTDSFGLNASYYWIDINTTAEITTTDSSVGAVKATVDVDIDPSVYMLGMTYKF